jgi:septum formation protein
MIQLPDIVLASGSPRRSEILSSVGWRFTKDVPDVDESVVGGEPAEKYVVRLAKEKASVVSARHSGKLVLAADTTVVIDGEIIGKPDDNEDARRMLKLLSGAWHQVLTGVAVTDGGEIRSGLERTGVKFVEISDAEIEFLVREGNPLDKAGAYAVQAQAALFIERIEGDYWNVVGLPVQLVYRLLVSARNVKPVKHRT